MLIHSLKPVNINHQVRVISLELMLRFRFTNAVFNNSHTIYAVNYNVLRIMSGMGVLL